MGEWGRRVLRHGTLLFSLQIDPVQQNPIRDSACEARMIDLLRRLMEESDCPKEQFTRLGLPP